MSDKLLPAADRVIGAVRDAWIPTIYEIKIRPQRTRAVKLELPEKENSPRILHTLLGIELQCGRIRTACPDLATARYLRVFARIGANSFAMPYDITKLSAIADELDSAWQRTILNIEHFTKSASPQMSGRTRAAVIRQMREEIRKIGAGEMMPLFNKPTRQRK
jgi:hypothetical protein